MKDLLTTYDVAQHCHVTMTTVVNWIQDGSLKAYRTKGGHRRIRREDFLSFAHEYEIPLSEKKRLLIVDDDTSIQTGLKKIFEEEGYEVDIAFDGFEAGVLLEKQHPSIVILDIIMPRLDGFFVCKYIKHHAHLKHTRIIVLTGYPSEENIKKAKEAGADVCFAKPVDGKILIEEVKKLSSILSP